MKKFIYGFITGFIIGALLLFSMPVFAASVKKAITVTYKNIKIVLDGKEIKTDVEPFQYSGRTFVPVRFVAEAFGAEVKWNDNKNTVEIYSKASQPEQSNENQAKENGGEAVDGKITQTPDGITNIHEWEGKQYIGIPYIQQAINPKGYDLVRDIKTPLKWMLIKGKYEFKQVNGELIFSDFEVLIDDVPTTYTYGYDSVEVNYYINTILPLIK